MTSCLVDFEIPKNAYLYYRRKKESSVRKKILSNKKVDPIYCTTMAFAVRKSTIIDNKLFFDENFKGYGWEDVDYFVQAYKKGIKLDFAKVYVTHRELYSYKNILISKCLWEVGINIF